MKVFAATVIILAVMVLFIGVNRTFILETAENLSGHLDIISESAEKAEKISAAEEYWKKIRGRASLSVSYGTIEEIDRGFIGLKSFTDKDREADFERELLLFRDTIEKMSRLERVFK